MLHQKKIFGPNQPAQSEINKLFKLLFPMRRNFCFWAGVYVRNPQIRSDHRRLAPGVKRPVRHLGLII